MSGGQQCLGMNLRGYILRGGGGGGGGGQPCLRHRVCQQISTDIPFDIKKKPGQSVANSNRSIESLIFLIEHYYIGQNIADMTQLVPYSCALALIVGAWYLNYYLI